MNGVSSVIQVAMDRVNFWFIGISLPKFCLCCLPAHTSTCMSGEVVSLAVWVDGEERSFQSPDTELAWVSLHFLGVSPPRVREKLALGAASETLLASPLGHIAGGSGSQSQTWLSLLNAPGTQCGKVLMAPRSLLPSRINYSCHKTYTYRVLVTKRPIGSIYQWP